MGNLTMKEKIADSPQAPAVSSLIEWIPIFLNNEYKLT